jgi:hypothetical protein
MRWVWVSALAVGALVGGTLLPAAIRRSSEAFQQEGTSFGASYAYPGQDSVIYTRMSHAVGRYEIVTQRRGSGKATVVSGDDWTAAFGVSGGERLAYTRIQGNVVQLVLLRPGRGPLAATDRDGASINLSIGSSGESLATVGNGVLTTWSMESLSPMKFPIGPVASGEERGRSNCWEAALSGDGARVAVSSSFEGLYFLDLVSLPTGARRMFRSSVHPMSRPRWSPDGSALTFVERAAAGWEVREACLDRGADRVIYRTQRFIESAELHRDGRHLLLTLGDHGEFEGYFTALHVFEADLASGELAGIGW